MSETPERDEFFDAPEPPKPAADGSIAQKKKIAILAALLALLMTVVGFLAGWYGRYYALDSEIRTFLWAKTIVEKYYYQPVEEAELYQRLFQVLSLDRYSELFLPEEYSEYLAEGDGEYRGTGLSTLSETVDGKQFSRIFLVTENSPALRAGLRKGMYVIAYGTDGEMSEDSVNFYRFAAAQEGEFTVRAGYAPDGSDAHDYTMQRESYQAAYVHYRDSELCYRFMGKEPVLTQTEEKLEGLDGKTAYIRLDEFSGNAASEFEQCLAVMKERGRRDLILDLRTDGGGYLDIMGDISSHLVKEAERANPVVAIGRFRDGSEAHYICKGNDFYTYFSPESHVYILADEYTASASECLIGALVDYKTTAYDEIFLRRNNDGVARTFGKGIMQRHFTNANGAAMKLTIATMLWPVSGRSIHEVGVTPSDGAIPIDADLIWGASDPMLDAAIARARGN